MNDGTIEFFSNAAGNLYSDVVPVHVGADGAIKITVNHVIAPAPAVVETEWIKRVKFQSPMLTKFWGRPINIYASVLLPKGYAEHPDVYYPSIYTLGHGRTPLNFSTTPPRTGDPNAVSPVTGVQSGYATYQQWSGDAYPRVICISLEQQTPYFADSYSVNSVNNGPYGDAVVQEMISFLEKQFRIIPKPYGRQLRASTSGWQSLALQLRIRRSSAARGSSSPIRSTHALPDDEHLRTRTRFAFRRSRSWTERYFQRTTDGQGVIRRAS
jgi:hypothetical protein